MKKLFTLLIMFFCAIGMSAGNYDIEIAGVQVTDANKDNIKGTGITGTVRYYPDSRVLYLSNATIKASGSNFGIYVGYSTNEGFAISVNGTCTIEASGTQEAICLCPRGTNLIYSSTQNFKFNVKYTGTNNQYAIYTQGNLDISSLGTITAETTGDYAIYDVNSSHNFYSGSETTIYASAKKAAIYGFTSFSLHDDACISSPRSGAFKESQKTILTNATGTTPATTVKIEPGYPVWVNGTHVTKNNASDVLGDQTIEYTKGHLYMYGGSYVNDKAGYCLEANQDLVIDVMDADVNFEQKYSSYSAVALHGGHKYTLMGEGGNGSITIKSAGQPGLLITDGSSVEFDHITANITSSIYSISGLRGGSVICNNSNLNLDAGSYKTVNDIDSWTFKSCGVTSPSGVTFDTSKKTFVKSGAACTGKLTIAPTSYGISIRGMDVNTRNYDNLWIGSQYNPEKNTLILSNCDFGYDGNVISITSGKPTTIVVSGNNKNRLISKKLNAIYIANTDVTIEGGNSSTTPTLELETQYTGTNSYAPLMKYGTGKLTIKNCIVKTTAQNTAVSASGTSATINVENSTIDANIKSNDVYHGAIEGFRNINLNNATIKSTANGIYSKNVAANIDLTGTNTITSTNMHGIFWEGTSSLATVIGSTNNGSLSIAASSLGSCAIMFNSALTIKNCTTMFNGINSGIEGGSNATLTIDNAAVKATSTTSNNQNGAICYITSFTTKNGVEIIKPTGAAYNSTLKGISADGKTICSNVEIGVKEYGITVNDVKVTSKNYTNIPVTSGSAKYDPSTKVLTLNNATINATKFGMTIDEEITLKLVGSNYITSSSNCITARKTSFTIDGAGTGKLYLKSTGKNGLGIYAVAVPMTIKNCTIDSEGESGIIGQNDHEKSLIIENANIHVKATGSTDRALGNYTGITLNNCYIESPVGAAYDSSLKGMALGGSLCNEITIKAGTDPHTIAPTVSNPEIAVLGATSSSIKLSWTAASDNLTPASKIEYVLGYTNKKTSEYKSVKVIGATTVELTGLAEETEYSITLRAYDEDGYHVDYTNKTVKTIKYVDDVAPTLSVNTVQYENLTYNSVDLSWIAASDNITTADNIVYEIKWGLKDDMAGTEQTAYSTGLTSYTITGLMPETAYEIIVTASDEVGNKTAYESRYIVTSMAPDVTDPVLPSDATVTITDITATTATLSWNPVIDDRTAPENIDYVVEFTTDGSAWQMNDVVGATSLTLTELAPETTYTVRLYAEDEAHNCSYYTETTFTTLSNADTNIPTLPADAAITVKEATENSITITWNPANDDKTDQANLVYEINVYIDDMWETKGTVTGNTEFKIDGLKADTEYEILIYVMDEAGNGESYPIATASTTADGIEAIMAENADAKMYNMSGMRVGKSYRGMVIINGNKYMKK